MTEKDEEDEELDFSILIPDKSDDGIHIPSDEEVLAIALEGYESLHTEDGVGFGERNKGTVVYYTLVREDGSLVSDASPIITDNDDEATDVLIDTKPLVTSYLYAKYPETDGTLISTQTVYKH
mgnify:CR=1 FL=1